ncbi:cyclophilin-like fold protein [Teredinibacter sp. KSP-S5-2]|uniref:cyclophilin-like fold protein n=1 Tax=Teredinibacter sp. KSP-S5-2 TaxID=3034506 RepID=UPI002935264E|nr:cyclophilin-like fold protein [Teredinibacter sp. KSP-S5-2]WNO08806.1 cyclophilin-like fold protein [Teredinibacter sp. KSP-S5-2]
MTKVFILINNTQVTADLYDNATSKSFISLLPLTLTLNDYNQTEKISDLPQRLPVDGAPEGITPQAGDITYYAPWGNLAIFYRHFGHAKGLIRLGRIESGIDLLKQPGKMKVIIQRAE